MEKNLKLLEESEALYDGMHQDPLGGSGGVGSAVPSMKGESYSSLGWDVYSKYCHSARPNKIETQLRCSLLNDELVRWEGTVKSVEILQVRNYKRDMLSYVYPKLLRNILTCLFGEANTCNCPSNENCGKVQDFVEGRWKCNMNKWNVYTYLIRMKMKAVSSGMSSVLLTAGNEFGNFTKHLQMNDKIWFEGTVRNKILQDDVDPLIPEEPIVDLNSVGCLSCHSPDLKFDKQGPIEGLASVTNILSAVQTSFKYLLNAIFNPVLFFK